MVPMIEAVPHSVIERCSLVMQQSVYWFAQATSIIELHCVVCPISRAAADAPLTVCTEQLTYREWSGVWRE